MKFHYRLEKNIFNYDQIQDEEPNAAFQLAIVPHCLWYKFTVVYLNCSVLIVFGLFFCPFCVIIQRLNLGWVIVVSSVYVQNIDNKEIALKEELIKNPDADRSVKVDTDLESNEGNDHQW